MLSTLKVIKFLAYNILMLQLTFSIVFAEIPTYQEIIIDNISQNQIVALTKHGCIIDYVRHNSALVYIPLHKISMLDKMGLQYNILPQNRHKKSIYGYPSIDQINKALQAFQKGFPSICQLYHIGDSYEGRPLYFIKISDHVTLEEDEPEVKYIASMHGDEPIGAMLCLNLIDDLLHNYKKDKLITELVNQLEIWIMPLMNPDGYVHDQRFNRQGVDLNRNFPDRVHDNNNSTKGRAIEVQHVMKWEFAHSSVLSANFHSGEAVVNYPYDSDFNPYAIYSATPDENLFREMALSYANYNQTMQNNTEFDSGITNGVAWYQVYGGMQDWSYVWMGCMEVTIELYQIKCPAFSLIDHLWNENREAMLNYLTWAQKGIRGIITDSFTGEPIFASIQVEGNDFQVYTDPDVGDYHRILLPGKYNLIISADGYETKYLTDIPVTDGYAFKLDLELKPTLHTSLLNIINMLKILSNQSATGAIKNYAIKRDTQKGLTDVIGAIKLISHFYDD